VCILTEWDEFKSLDWADVRRSAVRVRVRSLKRPQIYSKMNKPAFVFDGRRILDGPRLKALGFNVMIIGRGEEMA
jgi:UDPglucose 6-dehydrogenase